MYSLWNIVLLLFVGFVLFLYIKTTKNYKEIGRGRKFTFILGTILFLVAQSSPVMQLAESFFIAHMVQQTITYFIIPLLLLYGISEALIQPLASHPLLKKFGQFFTKPLLSLITFTLLFSVFYLPFIFNVMMSHLFLKIIALIILLPFAFFEWRLIISYPGSKSKLLPLQKILYLVGLGLLFTPLGFILIFSGEPLYQGYAYWDQQAGGTIWKTITVIIYVVMMASCLSEAAEVDKESQ